MDPLIQASLLALVFGAAAFGVFWLSMRSDRR
ncbi:MAG TPA: hypothetical protein VN158_10925 [Caulobacter sp.]|nr:hypothetical protein [Caulobacter sp.]